ncbi:MAG: hypothetical protein HY720_26430 [Planctomycetes bacterium]|nr:hypothetical protein [Planctomycetota bacterium]
MKQTMCLLWLAALAAGCGPDVEVAEDLKTSPPERVAVLLFEAPDLEDRDSTEMRFVRRIFYSHWANLPFRDMPLNLVDMLLAKNGLDDVDKVRGADPEKLGELLQVDAVVQGEVTSISNIAPLVAYRRAMGGEFRLVDCRPGKGGTVLWRSDHEESEWGGPLLESGQVITGIRRQIENSSAVAFYRICDRFCRRIVETMPPEVGQAVKPQQHVPQIGEVEVRLPRQGPLAAGDRIEVALAGEPQHVASFDIGIYRNGIPMTEVSPGKYSGTYTVQVGDAVEGAQIRAQLSTVFGETAVAQAQGSPVAIRARPPLPPAGLEVRAEGAGVLLTWKPGSARAEAPEAGENAKEQIALAGASAPPPPAAGYLVYRAVATPLLFEEIGETRGPTEFRDESPGKGPVFYLVLAVDQAGNRSYPTPFVELGAPKAPAEEGEPK